MTEQQRPKPPPKQLPETATPSLQVLQVPPGQSNSSSSASNDQVAALQDRVAETENKLHEERFIWVLVLVVLFDAFVLLDAQNWSAPIVIGVLELVGLLIFAQKCRVDPIMPLIDRLTGMLGNGKNGS